MKKKITVKKKETRREIERGREVKERKEGGKERRKKEGGKEGGSGNSSVALKASQKAKSCSAHLQKVHSNSKCREEERESR